MTVKRLDHAGSVVEDLAAAVAFFVELGLEVEGTTTVEGAWVDQLVGLDGVNADMAMLKVPGGHGRIELSAFRSPTTTATAHREPVDTPGIPRLAFVVDDLDDVFGRLRAHGAELVGEMAQYEQFCRYGYVRGPGGAIIGLVEELPRHPRTEMPAHEDRHLHPRSVSRIRRDCRSGVGVDRHQRIAVRGAIAIGCFSPEMKPTEEYVGYPTETRYYYKVITQTPDVYTDYGDVIFGERSDSPIAYTAEYDKGVRCTVRPQPSS